LIQKAKTEKPKTVLQQLQTGLTGLTGVRRLVSGDFEAEDMRRVARLASRLSRLRSSGIRPMEKI
jgi:hypothetical protein